MKKRLFYMFLAIVMMVTLTACNSSGTNPSAAPTAGTSPAPSAAPTADQKTYTLTMATIYTDPAHGDVTYRSLGGSMEHFIDQLKERSGGRLVVEGYYGGVLGAANDAFQQMERGEIDIYFGQPMSSIDSRFGAWNIPFLFTNYEDAIKVACDPEGEFFKLGASWFADHNAVLLSQGVGNIRGVLNAKKQVATVSDVKDLKIRTYEDAIVNAFWQGICNATPLSISEVYTSLQTNAVDGLEFSPDSILTRKYYEVAKFYSDVNWQWANGACFVMNSDSLSNLPADLQQLVSEIAWEAALWQAEHQVSDVASAIAALESNGVTVYSLTDADRETWITYADSIADSMRTAVGAETYDAIVSIVDEALAS